MTDYLKPHAPGAISQTHQSLTIRHRLIKTYENEVGLCLSTRSVVLNQWVMTLKWVAEPFSLDHGMCGLRNYL